MSTVTPGTRGGQKNPRPSPQDLIVNRIKHAHTTWMSIEDDKHPVNCSGCLCWQVREGLVGPKLHWEGEQTLPGRQAAGENLVL